MQMEGEHLLARSGNKFGDLSVPAASPLPTIPMSASERPSISNYCGELERSRNERKKVGKLHCALLVKLWIAPQMPIHQAL